MGKLPSTLLVSAWLLTPGAAQTTTDYYPEVRKVLLEAEAASVGITILPDRSTPLPWAARLYARAGYLEDAARAWKKAGEGQEQLISARVLYGDLPGGLNVIAAIRDSEKKAQALIHVAQMLWKMGDRTHAETVLAQADRVIPTLADPAHRKLASGMFANIEKALPDEPPLRLSAVPNPVRNTRPLADIPRFPIAVDGYRDSSPTAVTRQASGNKDYLTQVYALIEAGDRPGLEKLVSSASSDFQKALALASLEHLLLQVGALPDAEGIARTIPDDGSDSSLSKAEALTAAAVGWGRKGDTVRSRQCFEDALAIVAKVGRELAFGKAVVTGAIAAAQAESGLTATSQPTFDLAMGLVAALPLRPKPAGGRSPANPSRQRFQDDAYPAIFAFQMRAHDLGGGRRTATLWRQTVGQDANTSILMAFYEAGQKDEALRYARSLKDPIERVPALLVYADSLLDEAAAPIF